MIGTLIADRHADSAGSAGGADAVAIRKENKALREANHLLQYKVDVLLDMVCEISHNKLTWSS